MSLPRLCNSVSVSLVCLCEGFEFTLKHFSALILAICIRPLHIYYYKHTLSLCPAASEQAGFVKSCLKSNYILYIYNIFQCIACAWFADVEEKTLTY